MQGASASAPQTAQVSLTAVGLANRHVDTWLADSDRSGIACNGPRSAAEIREFVLRQVAYVVNQADALQANRRWLCGTLRAWSSLQVLFPRHSETVVRGVTGDLPRHIQLVLEREYTHILAEARSIDRAKKLLVGDAQTLELQVEIGDALRTLLGDGARDGTDWLPEFRTLSLAMAEYLHRHAIGLQQILSDSNVMTYTGQLARIQRECRAAPQMRAAVSGA
jgi:hypothetical protein